jgi:WXG100 family type VII secretion target
VAAPGGRYVAAMTLKVDPGAIQRCAAALGDGAKDLQHRLVGLDRQVGELLDGWRGASGGAYASAWELWRRGAGEVQLGLSQLATSVGAAGGSYQHDDATAARALQGVRNG